MAPPKRPVLERFWEKVDRDNSTGCWLWMGGRIHEGYGVFWLDGKSVRAHRFSYEHFVGPIPSDLVIDHLCRVTSCVNPAHLEPVTNSVNITRGTLAESEKTHCPQGHPYDDVNTYVDPDGHRHCRTCKRERNLKKYREFHWQGNPPNAAKTHCPQGHPYTDENTYRPPSGARICRACAREKAREWWSVNGRDWDKKRRERVRRRG